MTTAIRACEAALGDGVDERLKIAAAPGDEDADRAAGRALRSIERSF